MTAGDLFPDCEVRSDVRCLADSQDRRCACAFVASHAGAHFCKWCRKKILGVVDDRVDVPEIDAGRFK